MADITKINVDGSTYNIKDSVARSYSYTTGEKAVGTWINGKTVYEGIITGSIELTANTEATIVIGNNIDQLISVDGQWDVWHSGSRTNTLSIGQYLTTNVYSFTYKQNGVTSARLKTGYDLTSNYFIIARYTKN